MFVAKRNLLVLAVAAVMGSAQIASAEDAVPAMHASAEQAADALVAPAPTLEPAASADTSTTAAATSTSDVTAPTPAADSVASTPPAGMQAATPAASDAPTLAETTTAAEAPAVTETPAAAPAAAPADAAHAHTAPHWSYDGDMGPWNWGGMAGDFKTCTEGKRQSPIDISMATVTTLPAIEVHYSPAPLKVKNNGHTAQVDYADGSYILVDGVKYNLKQFHFHSPSEHSLGGKYYDMVVHLVHKTDDDKLGVIDVMMRKGSEHPALKAVFDNMPKEVGTETQVADAQVNAADLLPKDLTYYNYVGSLTTPPCSEGVNWMVMTNTLEVSDAQVAAFTGVFPKSARPVQPVNGRVVSLGN